MIENNRKIHHDRRKHHDKWVKIATLSTSFGCLLIMGALCFLYLAQPEMQTGMAQYNNEYVRQSWLRDWLPYAHFFAIFGALAMLISLVLRRKRNRRKLDSPIIIHIVLAVGSMILMMFVQNLMFSLP